MIMKPRRLALVYLMVSLITLAGCALGDVAQPTAPPPITLAPPPTAVFAGECEQTPDLDAWLQGTATFLVPEFIAAVNDAAGKPSTAVYADVMRMARLRDAASDRPTPDCATELQLMLMDAMNTAVERFQAYANGDVGDTGETVAVVIGQLDQVSALQNELIGRLEAQYRAERGQ